jgi:hypothetical protein
LPFSFGITFTFSAGAALEQPEQALVLQPLQPWQRLCNRLNRPPWQPLQLVLQLLWQREAWQVETAWQLLLQLP